MVYLEQRQAISPYHGTLLEIVISKTLTISLKEGKEKEFGDGNPWTTVHEPRLNEILAEKL